MINLDTTTKQREWLVSQSINAPLSASTMERINDDLDWDYIAKVINEIELNKRQLELLHDDAIQARNDALTHVLHTKIDEVQSILADIKRAEGERAIQKAKVTELMSQAKAKINELCDELNTEANKYNSSALADLSRAVRTSVTR